MLETINLDNGLTTAGQSLAPFGSLFTGSGVLRPNAFTVSALGSPGMFVEVSGSDNDDIAIIRTDDGATYFIRNTFNVQVPITANSSGVTKTDAIVLFVDLAGGDDENTGSPGASQVIAVRRGGVSTGLPTDGEIDAETGNNPWIFLKSVTVTHGTGEIEGADVTGDADRAYLDGSQLSLLSIVEGMLADGAVGGTKVSTSAIYLGHASKTSNSTTTSASAAAVSGLSVPVTVPDGGRKVKLTFTANSVYASSAAFITVSLWDGTVGSGTQVASFTANPTGSGQQLPANGSVILSPSAGAKTYNVGLQTSAGTATLVGAATTPAQLLVELI